MRHLASMSLISQSDEASVSLWPYRHNPGKIYQWIKLWYIMMLYNQNTFFLLINFDWASNLQYKLHLRQYNCWSLRCSWSIACHLCSNYILILDLTPDFSGLGKGKCKTRGETFKFWHSVHLMIEVWCFFIWRIEWQLFMIITTYLVPCSIS